MSAYRQAICLLALLCGSAAVPAQLVRPGSEVPVALDRVQPAGTCRKDDPVPGEAAASPGATLATSASPHAAPAPDLSCAMSPADLATGLARGTVTPVDVRSAHEHEQARIAGAMQVPLPALRHMAVLRSKPLVLLGNGKAERELYVACAALRAGGFARVHVLRGGLPQWLAEGRPVVSRDPPAVASTRLSTAELWAESLFDANLVLATPAQARLREQLRLALPVADLSAATLQAVLERRRRALRNAPLAAVVLLVEPGVAEDTLRRAQRALAPAPVLVYAQPFDQYRLDMARQQAMWANHARGPRQPPCGL